MSDTEWKRGKAKPKDPVLSSLPAACTDERKAVETMEALRWGDAPLCPRCGSCEVRKMLGKDGERSARFLWRCGNRPTCGKQFTVRIGTVMEESLIPLRHWCYAFWRATTSKKGVAAKEIERQCQISYKSALFMMHRIREAFRTNWGKPPRMAGDIETDEMYLGGVPRGAYLRGQVTGEQMHAMRWPVVGMLQRGGDVRAFPVERVNWKTLDNLFLFHVDRKRSKLHTDGAKVYPRLGKAFGLGHGAVNHDAYEFVRGDVTTNRVEGFFGLIRRGMHGIYHSVSREHLPRYINEFEWRFNHRKMTDGERVAAAIRAAQGKRLMYRQPVDDDDAA
jgi:transposase-like protein